MSVVTRLICVLLLCCGAVMAQRGDRDPTPQDRDVSPERQLVKPQIDPVRLQRDANELAQLAGTVPPEVDRAVHGVLAKDLKDKLKRIEKLCKRLRSELTLK